MFSLVGMVNSKQKGNRGERDVVHILNRLTGVLWYRVPFSGACSNGDMKFKGDVYSKDDGYSEVIIEVKNHTGYVSINDMFNPKSELSQWIEQVKGYCDSDFPFGILFFKSGGKWFWYVVHKSGCLNNDLVYLLRSNSKTYYDWGMLHLTFIPLDKKHNDKLKEEELMLECSE